MKKAAHELMLVLLICFLISGCSTHADKDATAIENSTALNTDENMSNSQSPIADKSNLTTSTKEEEFIADLVQAINEEDIPFIQKSADYYDPNKGVHGVSEGLSLFRSLLNGEKISQSVYIDDSNIAFVLGTKLCRFETESGLARNILIYHNEANEFIFSDPLITMGSDVMSCVDGYFQALKNKDIRHFYDYLVIVHEDSEAKPYADPAHNEEYMAISSKLINKKK